MRKTSEAGEYAAYVQSLSHADRLLTIGQLAVSEAATRCHRDDQRRNFENTDGLPDVVRGPMMAVVHSGRRCWERVLGLYETAVIATR